jgi:hypothetical protein
MFSNDTTKPESVHEKIFIMKNHELSGIAIKLLKKFQKALLLHKLKLFSCSDSESNKKIINLLST